MEKLPISTRIQPAFTLSLSERQQHGKTLYRTKANSLYSGFLSNLFLMPKSLYSAVFSPIAVATVLRPLGLGKYGDWCKTKLHSRLKRSRDDYPIQAFFTQLHLFILRRRLSVQCAALQGTLELCLIEHRSNWGSHNFFQHLEKPCLNVNCLVGVVPKSPWDQN